MRARTLTLWAGIALAALAVSTEAADKKSRDGGLIGNSYASQLDKIDDTTLRITTRKKVTGDINEITRPGTTMYKAWQAVLNGTTVRAAVEAKNLGFNVFQVVGERSLTQNPEQLATNNEAAATRDLRSASVDHGVGAENSYTFAPGHYGTDVELGIEVTVKLIAGEFPVEAPKDYVDVAAVLKSVGL